MSYPECAVVPCTGFQAADGGQAGFLCLLVVLGGETAAHPPQGFGDWGKEYPGGIVDTADDYCCGVGHHTAELDRRLEAADVVLAGKSIAEFQRMFGDVDFIQRTDLPPADFAGRQPVAWPLEDSYWVAFTVDDQDSPWCRAGQAAEHTHLGPLDDLKWVIGHDSVTSWSRFRRSRAAGDGSLPLVQRLR